MNERIKEWVQGLKKPKVLILAGLLGIILIFLSSFGGGEEKTPQETKSDFSFEDYRICLQEDIKKMVTEITGSKKVNVVITLENSISYSYADTREETSAAESKENGDSSDMQIKAGYITLENADGGEEALLVTAQMPEIRGVAIVCEGGDNKLLNEKIKNTVTAALNITSKRVYICGRN